MNQPKLLFSLAAFFIICLSLNLQAQTPTNKPSEPSFDMILQTVVGSNDGVKSEMPPTLSGIVKKIKADFPFANYRLTSTAIQRMVNRGGVEFNSVSYTSEKNLPVFSTWDIDGVLFSTDEGGRETVSIQNFRFNQRIPITDWNDTLLVNYEQIGLKTKFNLIKNSPTVVGSLTTLKPDELMFLVLTVRPAEK